VELQERDPGDLGTDDDTTKNDRQDPVPSIEIHIPDRESKLWRARMKSDKSDPYKP
jgi:hypothetical protein